MARRQRSPEQGMVERARAMAARDPELGAALGRAWGEVAAEVEGRMLARRPRPKVFEVHHATEVARARFLEVFLERGMCAEIGAEALAAAGFSVDI